MAFMVACTAAPLSRERESRPIDLGNQNHTRGIRAYVWMRGKTPAAPSPRWKAIDGSIPAKRLRSANVSAMSSGNRAN
jgi:hypothetical protein